MKEIAKQQESKMDKMGKIDKIDKLDKVDKVDKVDKMDKMDKLDKLDRATLLWIDLEMTGLEPEKDRIVELAAVATGWDLEPIVGAQMVLPVRVPEELMRQRMVGEFWEKNAESRRALIEQSKNGVPSVEAEAQLLDFIKRWFGDEVYLAGNSIHQDQKFIEREWPRVAQRLHYRMLDVSAWKLYFENVLGKKFMKREAHRALDDIEGSIAELKWYVELMRKGLDEKGAKNDRDCADKWNC